MTTHITVSHGADFYGRETFSVRQLHELGQHAQGSLPAADREPLTRVLDDAGEREHSFGADEAALLAILLRRLAAGRFLKHRYVDIAARLGRAAALAAGSGEPWTWTRHTEGTSA
ncbi:hypothetical protein [Streptomyces sp. NPDC017529]|uniref:DUF7739 domain-containing protein n=1 Tax=Streptomyces sp. NPDC017529 TaxID=3365000 RepID=UPI0037B5F44C